MKVSELLKIDGFKLCTPEIALNKAINDIYISDLLSWVLGHVKNEETVLITVINSINVVAVASLLNMSAIIFCDGVVPNHDVIEKANKEGIALFSINQSSVDTLRKIDHYESIL